MIHIGIDIREDCLYKAYCAKKELFRLINKAQNRVSSCPCTECEEAFTPIIENADEEGYSNETHQ